MQDVLLPRYQDVEQTHTSLAARRDNGNAGDPVENAHKRDDQPGWNHGKFGYRIEEYAGPNH